MMEIEELYDIYRMHPRVSNDTRHGIVGSIFFAISSDNKENKGNQYAEHAVEENRSAYAVIDDPNLKNKHQSDDRYILVKNCEQTLLALAKFHREKLNIPIIAITGSNGKTTTKELLRRTLGTKYSVGFTHGNLNNNLGVPLTLLGFTERHEIGIVEIGTNALGQAIKLCEIVQPDLGVVTNCGKDHLKGYGTKENVIKANCELYSYLRKMDKVVFVNSDDETLMKESGILTNRYFYGTEKGKGMLVYGEVRKSPWLLADITVSDADHHLNYKVQTKLFGKFWLPAVLCSFAVGKYFGVRSEMVKRAIESYEPDGMLRSERYEWEGNEVLLDCYNANPSSMKVFLEEIFNFKEHKGEKIYVLGTMMEGGETTVIEHLNILQMLIDEDARNVFIVDHEKEKSMCEALKLLDKNAVDKFKYFNTVTDAKKFFSDVGNRISGYYFVKGSNSVKLQTIFGYDHGKN